MAPNNHSTQRAKNTLTLFRDFAETHKRTHKGKRDKEYVENAVFLNSERQQCEAQQRRIANLETEHSKKDKDNWDKINGYKAEIQSLKAETEAAKQTIEKLQGSIAENYNYKLLAEQNEMLKADLQSYKNQVANLNNTIATMKIESDILDNYKTKILQEQNEQYVRRIQMQEKEQRMVAPLMNEMINTLQRHGLTASL